MALKILIWECKRIFSNGKQTLALFVVPSAILLFALVLFPSLTNYLSTGSLLRPPMVLVDPPDHLTDFLDTNFVAQNFPYDVWTVDEYQAMLAKRASDPHAARGSFFVLFDSPDASTASFMPNVHAYYDTLPVDDHLLTGDARIYLLYDNSTVLSEMMAQQFENGVLPDYADYLLKHEGMPRLVDVSTRPFDIDGFQPVTPVLENRLQANAAAARVVPALLFLILYYCVYSLCFESLAADRERGFLAKLMLTPTRPDSLIAGKALCVSLIAHLSSLAMLAFIILASWTNLSNHPLSLIPFGLLLVPTQLILIVLLLLLAAVGMTLICFKIILDVKKHADVMINLQLPLLLFLIIFFASLFRPSVPLWIEYMIPLHNVMLAIQDVMLQRLEPLTLLAITVLNVLIYVLLYINISQTLVHGDAYVMNPDINDHNRRLS